MVEDFMTEVKHKNLEYILQRFKENDQEHVWEFLSDAEISNEISLQMSGYLKT